jgi:hypothetical protein
LDRLHQLIKHGEQFTRRNEHLGIEIDIINPIRCRLASISITAFGSHHPALRRPSASLVSAPMGWPRPASPHRPVAARTGAGAVGTIASSQDSGRADGEGRTWRLATSSPYVVWRRWTTTNASPKYAPRHRHGAIRKSSRERKSRFASDTTRSGPSDQ